MGAYKKNTPFAYPLIKRAAGALCFAICSERSRPWLAKMHGVRDPEDPQIVDRSWKHRQLERLYYKWNSLEIRKYDKLSNKFKKMYQGAIPKNTFIRHLRRWFYEVDLKKWRDHPYFFMLLPDKYIQKNKIKQLYACLRGPVHKILWPRDRVHTPGVRSAKEPVTRKTIDALRARSFDYRSLFALTAIVRDKRYENEHTDEMYAAEATREIFAEAVCSRPFLYIAWKLLAKCYEERIWTPSPDGYYEDWFEIEDDDLEGEIIWHANKVRKAGKIKLPPESLVKKINQDITLHKLSDLVKSFPGPKNFDDLSDFI